MNSNQYLHENGTERERSDGVNLWFNGDREEEPAVRVSKGVKPGKGCDVSDFFFLKKK